MASRHVPGILHTSRWLSQPKDSEPMDARITQVARLKQEVNQGCCLQNCLATASTAEDPLDFPQHVRCQAHGSIVMQFLGYCMHQDAGAHGVRDPLAMTWEEASSPVLLEACCGGFCGIWKDGMWPTELSPEGSIKPSTVCIHEPQIGIRIHKLSCTLPETGPFLLMQHETNARAAKC